MKAMRHYFLFILISSAYAPLAAQNKPYGLIYEEIISNYLLHPLKKRFDEAMLDPYSSPEEIVKAHNAYMRASIAYTKQTVDYEDNDRVTSSAKTYHELGIDTLIAQVPTQLVMGKASLAAHLCQPTVNQEKIIVAQNKQKVIESNKKMQRTVRSLLYSARKGEKRFLTLWNTQSIAPAHRIAKNYSLTNYASINNGLYLGSTLLTPAGMLYNYSIEHMLNLLEKKYPNDCNVEHESYLAFKKQAMSVSQGAIEFANISTLASLLLSFLHKNTTIHHYAHTITGFFRFFLSSSHIAKDDCQKYIRYSLALDALVNAHSLYTHQSSPDIVRIHQSLIDIKQYLTAAQKLYSCIKNNPALKKEFPDFCPAYEDMLYNKNTRRIIKDLQTKTFDTVTALCNKGRVYLVFERLMEEKEAFVPLLNAMGEIDKYAALVEYKQQNPQANFNYTLPVHIKTTSLNAVNFVNPAFVNSKPNSMALDTNTNVFTVTGPNGHGKSFAAKGVLANVVFNQTFGITAAQEFTATPFHEINYHANVSDESGKLSRFEAEVKSLGTAYKHNLLAAHEGKPTITLIDEPASATNPEAGKNVVDTFIQETMNIKNNQSITGIITHYNLKNDPGVERFHVDADEKFVLKRGKSFSTNAEKLFNDELASIETQVQEMIKKSLYKN